MDNLQNQNSPLQGFEALESFIRAFLLCDMPVRSRSVAIMKTRSRPVNSFKLKSLREAATSAPFKQCCLQALVLAKVPPTLLGLFGTTEVPSAKPHDRLCPATNLFLEIFSTVSY